MSLKINSNSSRKKGIKVLFLYPNTFGMNMLPPAIALFSAILKNEGHQVKVFDTTYYAVDHGIADEDINELEKFTGDFVFNPLSGTEEIRIDEPIQVLEVGTGFMMIKRSVFEKFREEYPQFNYKPDHNRSEHFDGTRYIHAFFDTVIDNETYAGKGHGGTDRYLSEDYMFCQFANKIGFSTWLCPWMKLGHVGTYVFNGSLSDLGRLDYAAHGMDTTTRPRGPQIIDENSEVDESGKKLSRAERRKKERQDKKKK